MVPNGWSKTYLKNIISGTIKNGYSPLPAANTTGYWVMSLGALTDNGINPAEIKPVELDEKVKQALLTHGDFLISRSNTPDKVGRSIRFKGEIEKCSYPDLMMKFRVDPEKADSDFIEIKLKSSEIRQYYKSCAAGSSSTMVKINKSVVENTPLLLPPFSEQKKIAQILSTWDQAIATTERLLELARQQKKALMQQLLTGKKRFPGLEGKWKRIHLKAVLYEEKGRNRSNLIDRVLSITNHSGFVLPEEQFSKRVASDDVSNYKIVKKGQFGYNPSRLNVGSFARLDRFEEGLLSPMYVVFSIKPDQLNSEYFLNWMQSNEAQQRINGSTQGSVRDSVGFDALCGFPFLLPSIEEQEKIASVLAASNQEIETLQSQLDGLKQEKKALMQALLTGKRRVNVMS